MAKIIGLQSLQLNFFWLIILKKTVIKLKLSLAFCFSIAYFCKIWSKLLSFFFSIGITWSKVKNETILHKTNIL